MTETGTYAYQSHVIKNEEMDEEIKVLTVSTEGGKTGILLCQSIDTENKIINTFAQDEGNQVLEKFVLQATGLE
jgi:hypothetical protein